MTAPSKVACPMCGNCGHNRSALHQEIAKQERRFQKSQVVNMAEVEKYRRLIRDCERCA